MASKSKKSFTNLSRQKSTASSQKLITPPIEEIFEMQFKRFCAQFNSWTVPNVITVSHKPPPGNFPQIPSETSQDNHIKVSSKKTKQATASNNVPPSVATVLTIFDNYNIPILNEIIFKHFLVDRSMLIALRKSLQMFDTLAALKLEFCQLEITHLRTLKTILQRNRSITDLSINGNPNRFQNFYILLKDTQLTHISMSFCQINNRGMHLIALQLSSPFDQTLMSLNLSSNFISDEGAIAIANALRINRTLLFLNLADNWLTDNGCITLMSVLKTFALKHEEIVIRRHRITNYLLRKADMSKNQKLKALQELEAQSLQSTNRKTSRDSSKIGKESIARRSSKGSVGSGHLKIASSVQAKKSLELDMELITQMVELQIGKDNHPFVKDCYAENNEIYCKGNFALSYLNLAYNKIGLNGLQEIRTTLRYQQMVVVNIQEGLSTITLEGNLVSEYCEEINYIYEIIKESRKSRSRRSSEASHESRQSSRRKKSGSSRISINL